VRPPPEIPINSELSLKQLGLEDAPGLFELLQRDNPRLCEWLPRVVEKHTSLEQYRLWVEDAVGKFEANGTPDFVVVASGAPAGIFAYAPPGEDPAEGEIGFWLGDAFTGRGIGRAVLARVIEYGFEELAYRSLLVTTAEGNLRSRRLVESLGFEAKGLQRDAELLHNVLVHHVLYYLRH